jgi:hypothetical protein
MKYLRNLVICAFRGLHPDVLKVTNKRIADFDRSIEMVFDDELVAQATAEGIDLNDFNLSMLMFLSVMSTETTVEAQVEEGIAVFTSIKPIP